MGAEQSLTGGYNTCDWVVTGFIATLVDVAAQTGSAFIDRGSRFPVPQPGTPVHPTLPVVGHYPAPPVRIGAWTRIPMSRRESSESGFTSLARGTRSLSLSA